MQKPKKTVEQRRWDAEEKAGFWLAEANEAQDRGLSSKEESCLAKAQYWLDRANLLSGQGERAPPRPEQPLKHFRNFSE